MPAAQCLQAFSVPVLGADNTDSAALPERAKEPAEALHVPMTEHAPAMEPPVKPLVASEPEPAVQTPTAPDQVKLPEAMKETADMADVEVGLCLYSLQPFLASFPFDFVENYHIPYEK